MSIAPATYHDAMKLLIIEDEPKTAGYLTRGLGEQGYVRGGMQWLVVGKRAPSPPPAPAPAAASKPR